MKSPRGVPVTPLKLEDSSRSAAPAPEPSPGRINHLTGEQPRDVWAEKVSSLTAPGCAN
jgi:hypothetical protein